MPGHKHRFIIMRSTRWHVYFYCLCMHECVLDKAQAYPMMVKR